MPLDIDIEKRSDSDLGLGRPALLAVFLLALAARSIYFFEIWDVTFFKYPVIDAKTYLDHARALASGIYLNDEAFWQGPLYPYLMALAMKIFGDSTPALHLLHALLGSANCALAAFLSGRVFNRTAGVGAGMVTALYGPLIFFDGELLIPTLAVCLNLLAMILILRAERRGKWSYIAAGAVLGLACLARPNSLVIAPAVIIWSLYYSKKEMGFGRMAARMAYFLFGLLLTIAPATVHNYIVSREFILISANGGANFWIGNNPDWRETVSIRPGLEWGDLMAEPYLAGYDSPGERSSYWTAKTIKYIKDDPLGWIRSLAVKTGQFFRGHEYQRNVDLYSYRKYSRLLSLLLWRGPLGFPYGLLAPLAFLGMIVSLREPTRERTLLVLYMSFYSSSVALFFVASRYRAPLIPVMAGMACFFAVRMIEWIKARETKRVIFWVSAALLGIVVCNWGASHIPGPPPADIHLFLGHSYADAGQVSRAIGEYEKAIELAPDSPDARLNAGIGYLLTGRREEARKAFLLAQRLRPSSPMTLAFTRQYLGSMAGEEGDYQSAAALYRAALEAYPYQLEAALSLANLLVRVGQEREARAVITDMIAKYPRRAAPRAQMGRIESRAGNVKAAIDCFSQASRFSPSNPDYMIELAAEHLKAGEKDKASRLLDKAEKINPADARIKSLRKSI